MGLEEMVKRRQREAMVEGKHTGLKVGMAKYPPPIYYANLMRVSKNQIVFGANYMTEHLPPSMGWIVWDKGQRINQSDGELAFSSFSRALRIFELNRCHIQLDGAIHPTQKPVALYKWLLKNYAKEGETILDTHLGSGSIAIACHDMGYSLTGYELDTDYYNAACKRLATHQSQQLIRFDEPTDQPPIQQTMNL